MFGSYFDEEEYNQLNLNPRFWEQTSFQKMKEFLLVFKNIIPFEKRRNELTLRLEEVIKEADRLWKIKEEVGTNALRPLWAEDEVIRKDLSVLSDDGDIENNLDFQLAILRTILRRSMLSRIVCKEEIAIDGFAVLISLKMRFDHFVSLIEKEEESSQMYRRIAFAIYHVIDHKEKTEKKINDILQWSKKEELENAMEWFMIPASVCEMWGVCVHYYALIPPYSASCVGLDGGNTSDQRRV